MIISVVNNIYQCDICCKILKRKNIYSIEHNFVSCNICGEIRNLQMEQIKLFTDTLKIQKELEPKEISFIEEPVKNEHIRKISSKSRLIKYKITEEEYFKILDEQKGCCAICNKSEKDMKIAMSIDHNHITGKVRGLLCINCNTALGQLKEDKQIMNNMIKYVEKFEN